MCSQIRVNVIFTSNWNSCLLRAERGTEKQREMNLDEIEMSFGFLVDVLILNVQSDYIYSFYNAHTHTPLFCSLTLPVTILLLHTFHFQIQRKNKKEKKLFISKPF